MPVSRYFEFMQGILIPRFNMWFLVAWLYQNMRLRVYISQAFAGRAHINVVYNMVVRGILAERLILSVWLGLGPGLNLGRLQISKCNTQLIMASQADSICEAYAELPFVLLRPKQRLLQTPAKSR